MSIVSIRLNQKEEELFKSHAHIQGLSMSEMFKRAVEEQIEDAYGLKVIEEYEKEKAAGTLETYTLDEVAKELGLE